MKVVLLGYMASGKSTIGKELALATESEFIDLDNYIEEEMNATIAEIFSSKGEVFFRKMEREMLEKVLRENVSLILSTGGGTPCYGDNMQIILDNSQESFYLQVSIPELIDRIKKEKDQRPIVKNIDDDQLGEFVGKHLFERAQFYSRATNTVNCTDKTKEAIVEEIEKMLL